MASLIEIAETQERRVLRAFRDVIQSIKDQASINEVTRLLVVGDVDGVIELLQLDEATFEPFEDAIRQAYRTGGLTGADQIGQIPISAGTVQARFSLALPTSSEWLANLSSRLITEVADKQVRMVRERLTESLAQGVNPRQSALDLIGRVNRVTGNREGGFIGMTSRQAQWVANARAELESLDSDYFTRELRDRRFDASVRKAIKNEQPLGRDQINRMIVAMQNRTVAFRGQNISKTETLNALRAGQYEAIRQAAQKGGLGLSEVTKGWDATGDARTRVDHLLMEQTYLKDPIPFNQVFIAPDGSALRFPGDTSLGASASQIVRCRCRGVYRIDFIARQIRVEGFS